MNEAVSRVLEAIEATRAPNVSFQINDWIQGHSLTLFISLFLFRYVRTIVNAAAAHIFYKPVPIPLAPVFKTKDVTVIIVTTDLMHTGIHNAVRSILWHDIHSIMIAAGGHKPRSQITQFKTLFPNPRVQVHLYLGPRANVRQQAATVIPKVQTKFFVKQDDHSYWPQNPRFLPSLLAPFEQEEKVVAVGSILRARHHGHPISFRGFWNFIGIAYLTTRAREFCASDCVDGGIGCLEGRFGMFRTNSFNTSEFLHAFLNEYHIEYFGFGKRRGPLNVDDDKFVTRYIASKGKRIKIQGGPDSVMATELGEWPRYGEQILRWQRTTWRSNFKELTTLKTRWWRFPWSMYTTFVYSFWKSSLLHDVSLFTLLWMGVGKWIDREEFRLYAGCLAIWIYGVRLLKIVPGAIARPRELVYLPAYLVWVYVVSLIRLYALLTCGNMGWGTEKKAYLKAKSGKMMDTQEEKLGSNGEGREEVELNSGSVTGPEAWWVSLMGA